MSWNRDITDDSGERRSPACRASRRRQPDSDKSVTPRMAMKIPKIDASMDLAIEESLKEKKSDDILQMLKDELESQEQVNRSHADSSNHSVKFRLNI